MASEIDFSDLYCALDSAATTMALSSRDWSVAADLAWLYGIFCGWDDGSDTIAARFRWNAEKVARLRRLRAAVEAFDINVVSDLAGRLLPSGGEVSTQYGVRWHAVPNQDEWDDWGFSDEEHAREEMASSPTPSTLLRLRAITLPVEPVVSDSSEEESGG